MWVTREGSNSKFLKCFSALVPKTTATKEQNQSEYNFNNPVHLNIRILSKTSDSVKAQLQPMQRITQR